MDDRNAETPAHDRHTPTAEAASQPPAGPTPEADPLPQPGPPGAPADAPPEATPSAEAEQRPSGALAITAFLVVAILVSWFGMYALNIVRN